MDFNFPKRKDLVKDKIHEKKGSSVYDEIVEKISKNRCTTIKKTSIEKGISASNKGKITVTPTQVIPTI